MGSTKLTRNQAKSITLILTKQSTILLLVRNRSQWSISRRTLLRRKMKIRWFSNRVSRLKWKSSCLRLSSRIKKVRITLLRSICCKILRISNLI